jgi:hypothetical protein
LLSVIFGGLREPKGSFGGEVLPRQAAADYFDPLADIGRGPGDDLDQAGPLVRRTVQYDVPLKAEEGHRDPSRPFPDHWWPQGGHSYSTSGGHDQTREGVGVPEASRVHR